MRLEGPHDLESVPTASEKDAPAPDDELTDEEGNLEGVENNPIETGSGVEAGPMDDTSAEEPIEKEDHEEDPSEEEPTEKEDPEEDSGVDTEGDSEVSEGQLMGSEDLMGDWEKGRRDHTIQDKQTGRQEDLEEEINSLWYRAGYEIGENCWKWGGCSRMCRGTCPLDTSDQ